KTAYEMDTGLEFRRVLFGSSVVYGALPGSTIAFFIPSLNLFGEAGRREVPRSMTIADYNSRLEQFVEEEQPPAPAPEQPLGYVRSEERRVGKARWRGGARAC